MEWVENHLDCSGICEIFICLVILIVNASNYSARVGIFCIVTGAFLLICNCSLLH